MSCRHALALSVALSCLAAPAAASAVSDALLVSADGSSWAPALEAPLFDGTRVWVPGDEETVALWARNNSSDPASLTVDFAGADGPSLLDVEGVSLTATVDGQRRTITSASATGLLTVARIEPGAQQRIGLTVALDAATGNQAQLASLDVVLVVTLSEIVAGSDPIPAAPLPVDAGPAPVSEGDPGPLPSTGLAAGRELAIAALLVLTGGWLLSHRRRGQHADR